MPDKCSDVAILVLSCDKFKDVWAPFFKQFFKAWPDCPYTVYLGANELDPVFERVTVVKSGRDEDWSSSFKSILEQIEQRYLLIWLEDAFILTPPKPNLMEQAFNKMKSGEAVHIHFSASPAPDEFSDGFGIYYKGAPYRANLVGFWDKLYLQNLLLPGESPWLFEIMGSYRTSYSDGFLCLKETLWSYLHLIEKGKWFPRVSIWNEKYSLELELSARQSLENAGRLASYAKSMIFNSISRVPWRYRVRFMHNVRRLMASY